MELSTIRRVPRENFFRKAYNNFLIYQACSVKMTGYWPRSFLLRAYGSRLRLGPQTRQKRTWPISSHLDLTLVNNPYLTVN